MKKKLLLITGITCTISLVAQQTPKEITNPNGSLYRECYWVKETKPFGEIIAERKAKGLDKLKTKFGPADDGVAMMEFNKKAHHPGTTDNTKQDEARQTEQGHNVTSTIENFEGQDGLGSYPQDPNGMIGTKYYVQTINSTIAAWDKSGTVYIPQTDLDALFGSVGECDCGDPVTVYDKIADRWIITEFEGDLGSNTNIDTLLFAVSKTNDPKGAYWIYAFEPYANSFNDYPKYHVWGNGYYMTCNCSNPDMVVAFERDSMLVGSKKAAFIAMPWNYGPGISGCEGNFFCPMMLDCDGTLPPANAPEYLFYYWDDTWGCGGGQDSIVIEKITVNWATKTGTINAKYQDLTSAAFTSNFSNTEAFDCIIPQPGNNSSNLLSSTDGYFGYRIPYLRWSSYNSAVMQFPVNVGTLAAPVAGIRWYELRQDTTTQLWSIYQQSTWAPSDGISRWEAGIAMNQNGDIGMEYSVSSPTTTYPGLRYTGRRYCDALNTMTLAEGTVVSGNTLVTTPQDCGNRWGDYSHLSVDPSDGITFWGTNMYAESGAGNGINAGTRIFSFQVPICPTGINEVAEPDSKISAFQDGGTLIINGENIPVGERVVVELFDVNGKRLMQKDMVTSSSTLQTSFNIASLVKAIYLVRLGNDSFQRVIKVSIQ
ncbi:MAG TPA: T9SS type A sorting domain-containing protein [Bacteroidia bacterium]|jgi:hypothetical protein|nr:T9SS type A sorting domain-containing protein [Bacteroidia bacterium]